MVATDFCKNQRIATHKGLVLLTVASAIGILSSVTLAQPQGRLVTTSDTLGATARQAMIDIFRKKDATSVDRYFDESFIQHDPNLADGLAGIKSFAAEVASSPDADITIYRTLVDGDFVLLHSRYEGVRRYGEPTIAFDLFRFADGKIVEHWGGQEPEESPNQSGRTQVDGPADVVDREKTEANRALVPVVQRGPSLSRCGSDQIRTRLLRTRTMHSTPQKSAMALPA